MPSQTTHHTLSAIITDRIEVSNGLALSAADWDTLVECAEAEGVAPMVYWALSKAGRFGSIPEPAQRALRALYVATWRHNEELFRELEGLMRAFDRAALPVVLLKGACFGLTIYPDAGLRPMDDLDLLVPASRLSEAADIAVALGFDGTLPEASPGLNEMLGHHLFLHKSTPYPVTLEIHYSLVADKVFTYAVPVDWFWTQTQPLDGGAAKRFGSILMLTPAAQVLYAAAHAMLQHGGRSSPLRWFYDLHLLIRYYDSRVDWNLLLSQARVFEWSSALAAALTQTQTCFDTPIPVHVRAALLTASDRHQDLVEQLQDKPATRILDEGHKLRALNWPGRIRLVLALVAPSPAYMVWRYQLTSKWQTPRFYIVRWWGILVDGVRTVRASFVTARR